jgi:hypothetical protein
MTTVELFAQYDIRSPQDLADLGVCSRQYASHIFRGRRGIGKDLALKLHALKGIPFEDLLQATKAPKDGPTMKPGPKPGRPRKPPESPSH